MTFQGIFKDENRKLHKGYGSLFRVNRVIAQIIPSGVWTTIEWDQQTYDLLEEMLIVNPWTFIPVNAGYYFLGLQVQWVSLAIGNIVQTRFVLNGVPWIAEDRHENANAAASLSFNLNSIWYLTPNDVVHFEIHHNAGVNRAITGNPNATFCYGYRIR